MKITLHQALFGYDSGHHLLASSLQIPSVARQLLAVATDLSGSAPAKGFDFAYTGLALPETNLYAVFCTWLAPEMPRPGCVWSHVLIIEMPDLAEIPDLGALRGLFQRPSRGNFEAYQDEVRFKLRDDEEPSIARRFRSAAERLLMALYENPDQPIVLPATVEADYEDLVFKTWSQQWPRLRRSFRFSTGSFANRSRGDFEYDLQITPRANRRAWHGHTEPLIIEEEVANEILLRPDRDWLNIAVDDLFDGARTSFRAFLQEHGADISSPRSGFEKLSRAYLSLRSASPEEWVKVLDSIALDFPRKNEALSLKHASLSPRELGSDKKEADRQWEIVKYLCLGKTSPAYGAVPYDLGPSVKRLWRKRRSDLVHLLSERPPRKGQERFKQFALAVAESIDHSDLQWLGESQADVLPLLINIRPRLATSIDIWKMAERIQWRLVEALEAQNIAPEIWAEIVHKMLDANTEVAAKEVCASAGQAAFEGALLWLAESRRKTLFSMFWREALRPLAEQRIQRASTLAMELALCVALSSSKVAERIPAARKDVQKLGDEPLESLPPSVQLPVAFFLLTIGLRASGSLGGRLLARGFFMAHAALASEVEPPESWRLLQPHLPEVWFWQQWDRCEMLRAAIRGWLKKNPTHGILFFENAKSPSERALIQSLVE